MQTRNRIVTMALAAALVSALPGLALAGDEDVTDTSTRDRVTDQPTDEVIDRPTDVVTDRPSDRPTDRCRQSLVDRQCVSDHPTDRPLDRCLLVTDGPRRCIDDHHPHDVNYRKLIWRLIHAHEWKKLVRLLHALGLL